ncbi:acetylornithine deacetylase [Microbaculum marinum]|uniref:Acetylornithine deacetylase n=1 Tax=Microbaculum marinum TaxID=1764581 RepID=A0AAW9S3K3_9HYPH
MKDRVAATIGLLGELVSFESLSLRTNLDIVAHIQAYLEGLGVEAVLSYGEDGERANLFATIGPRIDGGVVLSGHTDVVPVDGQDWQTPPFTLVNREGRLFARGSVDMKGFIACALAAVPMFQEADLKRPIHLAFTFDEETGSRGARVLSQEMGGYPVKPAIAIVGEPTEMKIIVGHKGGYELKTTVTGLEGHASDPSRGVNAIFFATRMIAHLEEVARNLAARPEPRSEFDPPFSTISVGTIAGGIARNVIAGTCVFDWELRPVPGDEADAILAGIEDYVREELRPQMQAISPDADIVTVLEDAYPGLGTSEDAPAVALVRDLTGINSVGTVPFGTDAGYFDRAGMSTVVFGPGSIEQAHKPDEFIELSQIEACQVFLEKLCARLCREA